MKLRMFLTAILLCLIVGGSYGIFAHKKSQLVPGTLVYASYHNGDDTLYFLDAKTFDIKDRVKLTKGYGFDVFIDPKGRIWVPIDYKPDSTTMENRVVVYDPNTENKTILQVGYNPISIIFKNNQAYVTCSENGVTPTIYKVDEQLHATLLKKVERGGLISSVQNDDGNLYWSGVYTDSDPKKDIPYPQVSRVSFDGSVMIQKLAEEPRGLNGLLYQDGHLFVGMQEKDGNIVEVDPATLKKERTLPYHDMVGGFKALGNGKLLTTNFSSRYQKGAKVSIYDSKTGAPLSTFDTKIPIEHISLLSGKYYVVDNESHKIEVLDDKGESVNLMDAPTMVTGIIEIGK